MIHAVVFSVGKKPLCINKLFILELNQIYTKKNQFQFYIVDRELCRLHFVHFFHSQSTPEAVVITERYIVVSSENLHFARSTLCFCYSWMSCKRSYFKFVFVFNITFQQGAVIVFHPIYIAWMSMIVTHRRGNLYWPFRTKHVSTRSWNYSKT